MQTHDIKINVTYLVNKSIILPIRKTTQFIEIAATILSQHYFGKRQAIQYAFVFVPSQILVQGEDLKKQFKEYSQKNYEDLKFLVDQELNDYINNNSNILGPPQQSQLYYTQPDIKVEIQVKRKSEIYNLNLDNDQLRILDLYEYLTEQSIVKKTQIAAFLHQLSATLYEFNNFQVKLSDVPSFEKDRKLVYLDDELVDKFRPQKVIFKQNEPKQDNDQDSPSKLVKIPQVENGMTINILSEDGPSRRNFQFVKIDPNVSVVDLKQLVCQYLGYNNPNVVDVDLLLPNGFQLNSSNKQNRSLSELGLDSKELSIIAKTRWIGGYDL